MAADTYDGALQGGTTQIQHLRNTRGIWSKKFVLQDLLTLVGAGTVAEANDVFQLLNIPANTHVFCAGIIPLVADGATLTADLGDGSNADGWVDGANLNSTTAIMTVKDDAYGPDNMPGKFYAAADTIDLKIITIGAQTSHLSEFVVWVDMVQIPTE